ncbi:MAG: hypothetical protein CMH30_05850 [Micavibrio sp.]|nr:hypothetical protein [Micavibrio sp.]|tara:strand:+ start:1275 stop:3098 length:1824 start_codon:yes stop_codon:yes gene_type:complete
MAYALHKQDTATNLETSIDSTLMNKLASHLIARAEALGRDIGFEVYGIPHKALEAFSSQLEAIGVSYAVSDELVSNLRDYWVSRGESFARAVNATPIWIKFAVSKNMPEKIFENGMVDTVAFTGFEKIGEDFATTIHRHLTFGGESMTSNNDALKVFDGVNGNQTALWLHTESPSRSDLEGLETLSQALETQAGMQSPKAAEAIEHIVQEILQNVGSEGFSAEITAAVEAVQVVAVAKAELSQTIEHIAPDVVTASPVLNTIIETAKAEIVVNTVTSAPTMVTPQAVSLDAPVVTQARPEIVPSKAQPANVNTIVEPKAVEAAVIKPAAFQADTPKIEPIKQQIERIVAAVSIPTVETPMAMVQEPAIKEAIVKAVEPLKEIIEKIEQQKPVEREQLITAMIKFDEALAEIPTSPVKAELREIAVVVSQALQDVQPTTPKIEQSLQTESPKTVEVKVDQVEPKAAEIAVMVEPLKPRFEEVRQSPAVISPVVAVTADITNVVPTTNVHSQGNLPVIIDTAVVGDATQLPSSITQPVEKKPVQEPVPEKDKVPVNPLPKEEPKRNPCSGCFNDCAGCGGGIEDATQAMKIAQSQIKPVKMTGLSLDNN